MSPLRRLIHTLCTDAWCTFIVAVWQPAVLLRTMLCTPCPSASFPHSASCRQRTPTSGSGRAALTQRNGPQRRRPGQLRLHPLQGRRRQQRRPPAAGGACRWHRSGTARSCGQQRDTEASMRTTGTCRSTYKTPARQAPRHKPQHDRQVLLIRARPRYGCNGRCLSRPTSTTVHAPVRR